MERLIQTVILGIIQGLTEWLPISSSGHLKIAEKTLGLEVPLLFDVALHLGTLAVVLMFFRDDVKGVISALAKLDFKSEYGRLISLIIVGSIPTAILGLAFNTFVETILNDVSTVALALLVCGAMLYAAKFSKENEREISLKTAFIVGLAQGFAVVPGLSRSGLTIATALILGAQREKAFKFSFLLSIPAIIGAFCLTFYSHVEKLASSVGYAEV
ncbi:undecaprenyl-diphosphate phosphatase, partial [Candidatus Bathyarchaeota archaeon]|nr:undecaprenyl-diphosphate phosphatase [Candidatus Bathyarchaeota archaeon]